MITAVQVVLFDLGNTLFFDNAAAWPRTYARAEAALWRVLHRAGVRVAPSKVYGRPTTLLGHYYELRGSGILEPGTFEVLRNLLLPHAPGLPDEIITRALRAMYGVTQTNWKVERAAGRTLRVLQGRGFRIGAISNGSDDWNAHELLNKARLRRYFEMVLTSAAHGRRKPDASIFQSALAHFQVDPQRAVMIGDNLQADILGASALGMHTIWIIKRVSPDLPSPIAQPDATVGDVSDVPACLN